MKEAFAQTAKKRAGPESAATVPPATPEGSPATKQGPIPFEVHQKTIENARTKAVEEYKAKYGWAEAIPEAEIRQAIAYAQRISADPVAHLQELIAELQSHPVHSQSLRSLAAKTLSAGRGQAPQTMPEPDVAITDGNGTVVGMTYSEKGLAARDAYLTSQLLAKVDEKYGAVAKTHEQILAEREQAQADAAGQKFASTFLQEVRTYPYFKDHEKDIRAEVIRIIQQYPENDPTTNHPGFLEAATLRAYQKIVGPKRQALDQAAAVASLKQKAAAQVEKVSGAAPAPTTRPKTPKELAKFLEQKAAARKAG